VRNLWLENKKARISGWLWLLKSPPTFNAYHSLNNTAQQNDRNDNERGSTSILSRISKAGWQFSASKKTEKLKSRRAQRGGGWKKGLTVYVYLFPLHAWRTTVSRLTPLEAVRCMVPSYFLLYLQHAISAYRWQSDYVPTQLLGGLSWLNCWSFVVHFCGGSPDDPGATYW